VNTIRFTCKEIANAIDAEVVGDETLGITSIAPVHAAPEGSITFVTGRKFVDELKGTGASAVILPAGLANDTTLTRLVCADPYLAYAKLTQLWADSQIAPVEVDGSASVYGQIGSNVSVGPLAIIEAGAVLGDNVRIGGGAFIGANTTVGDSTIVHPNATVLHGCKIGADCEIHSGAVIGADGFGFAPMAGGWQKIHQLGAVSIGNRVSVGACTTIDRGALEDTVIGDGVILDNHIQVAHNVVIGQNTAIAGCTGIAGSAVIGSNCRIGGAVSIVGHINICDRVTVTANSFVNSSIKEPGSYSSGFPLQSTSEWRKNAVRLLKLNELSKQVSKLKS